MNHIEFEYFNQDEYNMVAFGETIPEFQGSPPYFAFGCTWLKEQYLWNYNASAYITYQRYYIGYISASNPFKRGIETLHQQKGLQGQFFIFKQINQGVSVAQYKNLMFNMRVGFLDDYMQEVERLANEANQPDAIQVLKDVLPLGPLATLLYITGASQQSKNSLQQSINFIRMLLPYGSRR